MNTPPRRAVGKFAAAAMLSLSLAALFAAPASADGPASLTAYDVQANAPQVQGDPTSDTAAVFPTNKQNEPTIAVNPTDERYLIAGSNDEQRQPADRAGAVRLWVLPRRRHVRHLHLERRWAHVDQPWPAR